MNNTVKALRKAMVNDKDNRYEWEIAFNTNSERGYVSSQIDIKVMYPRKNRHEWIRESYIHTGATKCTYTAITKDGSKYYDSKYIVIKRHLINGYLFSPCDCKGSGQQLHDEIAFWLKYETTPYADLLCPILKKFETKSDHNNPRSLASQDNVIIISQKARYIGNAEDCCIEAERLNNENGYYGETASERETKLERFARLNNWWDVMHNSGNSGVIFDYEKNCYKAVFVDYAL